MMPWGHTPNIPYMKMQGRCPCNEEEEKEEGEQIIKIEVKGGVVTDVKNLPEGCKYEVIDHDVMEEGERE